MSTEIKYQIKFHSEWHCSTGQSDGFTKDLTVIRDQQGLPVIPGKTLKGLLHDAAKNLEELNTSSKKGWTEFTEKFFGKEGEMFINKPFFTNAELPAAIKSHFGRTPQDIHFLYRDISSTAIDKRGVAKEHSLRIIEVVAPLTLEAAIKDFTGTDEDKNKIKQCMQWIKRMGLNRNRGLGQCTWSLLENNEICGGKE